MNFASTIIATAERVPLPDVIIRTAIHRLCSRTATRLATGNAESGCGWGSLSLWMARQFPHSLVTAVSNSNAQREYIEGEAPTAPDDERNCARTVMTGSAKPGGIECDHTHRTRIALRSIPATAANAAMDPAHNRVTPEKWALIQRDSVV